jgi:hypothetical protein
MRSSYLTDFRPGKEQIVTEKLDALIERARTVKMTGEQREKQRRSFAYGNTKIENDLITREMVDEQAEAQKKRANG